MPALSKVEGAAGWISSITPPAAGLSGILGFETTGTLDLGTSGGGGTEGIGVSSPATIVLGELEAKSIPYVNRGAFLLSTGLGGATSLLLTLLGAGATA